MTSDGTGGRARDDMILDVVRRYWGHDGLRELQGDAIRAGLDGRDALVVMPTGGGKSLCYQVPPAVRGTTVIVVSPLISLMQDQVAGLEACGYPAAALHSGIERDDQQAIEAGVLEGRYRVVYMSPERLLTPRGLGLATRAKIGTLAIDEAHCISQWGHDFRPEYRRLPEIRERLPDVALQAFTATATPRVREDIVRQLGLRHPTVLVGRFDRPNLTYRVQPRARLDDQVEEVLRRHIGARAGDEAAIVYCLSRKDTERLAESLTKRGLVAKAYHAGLDTTRRARVQRDFAREKLNIVVATVAFGMGIDRSNVRCVVHATMPRSVEAFQQETGRAGRDGLPAECVLLYSPADAARWKRLIEMPGDDGEPPDPERLKAEHTLLADMQRLASSIDCRHRALSEYFGQAYEPPEDAPEGSHDSAEGCGACDVCLGEIETTEDALTTAKKIISCVLRFGDAHYGVGHLVDVLMGSKAERVLRLGHDSLSTHGILGHLSRQTVMSYVHQLIDQGALGRTEDEYPVVYASRGSAEVLKEQRTVRLIEPAGRRVKASAQDRTSWEGVDRELFETLRDLRREIAQQRGVPPYVVFSDATLRELARDRPQSLDAMLEVHGIGQRKVEQFGEAFLEAIRAAAPSEAQSPS